VIESQPHSETINQPCGCWVETRSDQLQPVAFGLCGEHKVELDPISLKSLPSGGNEYEPDRVSHPGETLAEVLAAKGIHLVGDPILGGAKLGPVLHGNAPVTPFLAEQLELLEVGTKAFWLKRQQVYDDWALKEAP